MEMTMAMLLGVGVGVVPLLGWLLWRWNDLWYGFMVKDGHKLPPGSMGLPVVGEMLHFLWYFKVVRRPDDYINSKRKRFGDAEGMYKSYLFGKPCIIACSPAAMKFIFQSDQSLVTEWPNKDIVGEHSLIAAQGSDHAMLWNFISKTINQSDGLRRIALLVQPRMIAAFHSWANRGTINAYKELHTLTFENAVKYFAGFEPGPVLDSLDKFNVGVMKGIRASRINIPGTAYHYALQCRKKAIGIFKEELEKRKKIEENSLEQTNDLLDGLMRLKDDEGKHLSDMEVLDNIVSVLLAAYESTALASTWAVYYLAKFPKVLNKLREETMALRGYKNGELVTSDEIVKLKYMKKVVEETIRTANVSAFIFQTAVKDIEYKGYKIPKGWNVIIWLRYLHTDPTNFEDPLCFEPDRWDAPPKAGTYRVFGGGSRLCPGNNVARLQLSIFLYYLTTGYKWELVNPNAKATFLPHPNRVDGVEITIKKL